MSKFKNNINQLIYVDVDGKGTIHKIIDNNDKTWYNSTINQTLTDEYVRSIYADQFPEHEETEPSYRANYSDTYEFEDDCPEWYEKATERERRQQWGQ